MNRGSDECHGRFLGPDAAIKVAKEYGGGDGVSAALLEFAEEHGIVIPVARYVMPAEIIARQVAVDHPERASMESLQKDFRAVEATYGDDVLHLVVATGYLAKLVSNTEIERYLASRYPEFLEEFRAIIAANSLEQQAGA